MVSGSFTLLSKSYCLSHLPLINSMFGNKQYSEIHAGEMQNGFVFLGFFLLLFFFSQQGIMSEFDQLFNSSVDGNGYFLLF